LIRFCPFSFISENISIAQFSIPHLFLSFFQISEFNLVQEATPIVDEDLLDAITLAAKSCGATAQLSIGKDIDIVRRVNSPAAVGDVTTFLHESPTPSQHFVERPTSLKVAARRLSSVDFPIAIPRVTRGQSVRTIAPPATSFCPGLGTQGIIVVAI